MSKNVVFTVHPVCVTCCWEIGSSSHVYVRIKDDGLVWRNRGWIQKKVESSIAVRGGGVGGGVARLAGNPADTLQSACWPVNGLSMALITLNKNQQAAVATLDLNEGWSRHRLLCTSSFPPPPVTQVLCDMTIF